MTNQDKVAAAADAALAYALWDAENTTKMDPLRTNEFIQKARVVREWLRTNGHDVVADKTAEQTS